MRKIMISVGEASGDLHGASVANALKLQQPDVRIFGMGGDQMRAAGVEIVYDIKDLGVIGLVEVIKNLPRLFRLRDSLGELMEKERPDALVIIDYPGFNVRLAKVAKAKGIPVVSYITPSAWAWGKWRAKELAGIARRIAAIFPFEAEVYREAGANVTFVGHPLLDIVKTSMSREAAFAYFKADVAKPVVLLMPGSRKQEIENLLPDMLAAADLLQAERPGCQFYLPVASTISREILQEMISRYSVEVRLADGGVYDLMSIADIAIAASGTATLETALMQVPTVIIYKVNALTYFLGRRLLKIPHFGLPNIVAGRRIMPELLQSEVSPPAIVREVLPLLMEGQARSQALRELKEVRQRLGETGAVDRVARLILETAGESEENK